MKMTKQKEAILSAVCTLRNHPTADEVYDRVRKDFPRISLGTVYRNLNIFAEKGDIRKISMPDSGDRFDYRIDVHAHLICNKCSYIYDVDADIDIKVLDENVLVEGYTLLLEGVCSKCLNSVGK